MYNLKNFDEIGLIRRSSRDHSPSFFNLSSYGNSLIERIILVNLMAQGLSNPDPFLSPTHLSIRRGRVTTAYYTHHDGVAQHYTSPFHGVAHWASL